MIEKKYKILIVVLAIVVMIGLVLIIIFPLSRRAGTSSSTTNESVATTASTSESVSTTSTLSGGTPPPAEDTQGVDEILPIDIVINKLPLIQASYSLFYDYNNFSFLANINAREGTAEAAAAKRDIVKWFSEQDVDMSSIKIEYLYK